MITVGTLPDGSIEIATLPGTPPYDCLCALSKDEIFTGEQSELAICTPPTDCEEHNEDWEEYALAEVLDRALDWNKRFAPVQGVLRFQPAEVHEVAGMVNRARLKIAMEGTGDVLPPSPSSARHAYYEFLTALLEFILSLPLPPESQTGV